MEFSFCVPVEMERSFAVTALRMNRWFRYLANRLIQGHLRYGPPDRAKDYLARLKREIRAYEESGNVEHLMNAANYCFLETLAPLRETHHNPFAPSATRRESAL